MQQNGLRINSTKSTAVVQLIVSLLVWLYIIYRAVKFEVIQDEDYSYFLAKTNYWKALPGTFNTHWLNTIFIKIFTLLPGADYAWKLRMLSILSWPLFAFSIIKLSQRFKNTFIGWLFFCLCILNPYLILYFSLARGYAAGCALLMFSVWQAGKLIDQQKINPAQWLPVFIPAAIGVLSNFSLLYFFLGLLAAYSVFLAAKGQLKLLLLKGSMKLFILAAITIVFAAASLLFIKYYTKEVEVGGGAGIVQGLFSSLIAQSEFIFLPPSFTEIMGFVLFGLLLFAIIHAGYQIFRFKKFTLFTLLACCCAGIILLNVFFHAFFSTVYLSDRRAIFFFCPLMFTITSFADSFNFSGAYKKILLNSAVSVAIAVLLYNAWLNINTRYFSEWPVQNKTKEALDFLAANNVQHAGLDLWQYGVLKHYYTVAFPGKYNFSYALIKKDSIQAYNANGKFVYDYLLLSQPLKDSLASWQTVLYFPQSGSVVLKYKEGK